jgi:hypothetical protein
MEYKEAIKKVQARKPKGNFMVIDLAYDFKMVLPHTDGMAFMAAIANAEQLNDPYNANHSITPVERGKVKVSTLSQEEYEHHKIAALLGITVTEAKEHALNSD